MNSKSHKYIDTSINIYNLDSRMTLFIKQLSLWEVER